MLPGEKQNNPKQNKLLSAKRKRELALGGEAIATDRAVNFLRIVKED